MELNLKNYKVVVTLVSLVLALLLLVPQCMYIVRQEQEALVFRFGVYAYTVTDKGLHFKIPYIEKVVKVTVKNVLTNR